MRSQLDEIDRCARAYGFEVGRGHPLTTVINDVSDDNPFIDSNWKDNVVDNRKE